jgi:DNA-binding NarL/FixJ family response regulator
VVQASETGWVALDAGRWREARSCFERALAVEETAEAWEGLSWSAWWLDDAAAVFETRRRAYRLYRARGDAADAARMATWLACDELDFHGAVSVADGWLQRAQRLLEPLEPGPAHGWLAFHAGYHARVSGDAATALELAVRAAQLGRRFGVPDLEMLGLALEGATLVSGAQVVEGMRCLDEATATALEGEATIPMSSAWTFCFLVSACTAILDFERAAEWCDRIEAFAKSYGSRYMMAFCRAEYGAVHLWCGRWDEAESVLEASVEDFARSRPAMLGSPLAALAELRRRQARAADATALLDRAGTSAAAQLCRARLALDRGDSREALELAERLLRNIPSSLRLGRAPALEVLVRARIACGEFDGAGAAATELRELARVAGTASLRAFADLAEAAVAAAGGEHDRARPLLEDAVDRFDAAGARFDAARARIDLAATLLALERVDAAEAEATAALHGLRELGAVGEAERAQALLGDDIPLSELTAREREVLSLVADGLTNHEIAERLVVSPHTVHRHVTNLLRKLGLNSRTAAAAHAVRAGLLERDA